MNLPSLVPLNKVTYSTVAGLVTLIFFWALQRYAGVELDTEGKVLITSLVTVITQSATAYLTPLARAEVTQIVQSPEAPIQNSEAVRSGV